MNNLEKLAEIEKCVDKKLDAIAETQSKTQEEIVLGKREKLNKIYSDLESLLNYVDVVKTDKKKKDRITGKEGYVCFGSYGTDIQICICPAYDFSHMNFAYFSNNGSYGHDSYYKSCDYIWPDCSNPDTILDKFPEIFDDWETTYKNLTEWTKNAVIDRIHNKIDYTKGTQEKLDKEHKMYCE